MPMETRDRYPYNTQGCKYLLLFIITCTLWSALLDGYYHYFGLQMVPLQQPSQLNIGCQQGNM